MIASVLAPSSAERPCVKHPRMWIVECHTCGYEPEDQITPPRSRCPKCHGFAWQRLPNPRALVEVGVCKPALVRAGLAALHGAKVWGKAG